MSYNCFSSFSLGGHFVQPSRTILAILVKGHKRKSANIFKLGHWPRGLNIVLFLALAAMLFNGDEPFEQFWYRGIRGTFV